VVKDPSDRKVVMTTRLIRRTAAAVAFALAVATPALVATSGADAATATRTKQEPTKLRVVTSGRVVDKDSGQATISGWLTKSGVAYAGQTVLLKAKPGTPAGHHRRFGVVTSGVTGADGTVSFTVEPKVRMLYKLTFAQNAEARWSASRVVAVAPRATTRLLVKAADTQKGLHVWGRLKSKGHGVAGRKVTLQMLPSGATEWSAVKSKWTHRYGRVYFNVTSPTDGAHYRLYYPGGNRLMSATSVTFTP
jgi:hypothetical protein